MCKDEFSSIRELTPDANGYSSNGKGRISLGGYLFLSLLLRVKKMHLSRMVAFCIMQDCCNIEGWSIATVTYLALFDP